MADAAQDVPDLLQRPALQSARAAGSALLAVARAGKRLVSVGERGIIVLSDDDGKTWRQAKVPVSVSLTNVRFVTERLGWAVGHSGVVLHSADAGETWSRQLDGVQAAALVLDAVRSRVGAAAADESARKELAEAERLVADGPDKPFLDAHFSDEKHGLVVGAYGLAFTTDDGGKHWRSGMSRIPNPKGKHLYRVQASGSQIFIAGEQGAFFRSGDGGNSFAAVATPYAGSYFGVAAGAGGGLLVFGLRGNAYWSGDAGRSWHKVDRGGPAPLIDAVRLADGTLLLIDQAGQALASRDEGRSLRRVSLGIALPTSGLVQAADGALVVCGLRGVRRVSLPSKLVD
ncbi:WD40/YVTN/BNR-like repeat-containing protein [Piscinibacter sp.]|uniref:WD40/YVTN/BNR-like repeat-containing protein n=1 Tax=Piscinibacter sp. TaxID=1903157 RepID=UPI002ED6596F